MDDPESTFHHSVASVRGQTTHPWLLLPLRGLSPFYPICLIALTALHLSFSFCPLISHIHRGLFLMSSRITRSAARLATDPPPPAESGTQPAAGSASSRKRKASSRHDRQTDTPTQPSPPSPQRKPKRPRTAAPPTAPSTGSVAAPRRTRRATMSQPGYVMITLNV